MQVEDRLLRAGAAVEDAAVIGVAHVAHVVLGDEESAADQTLTDIAESIINGDAIAEDDSDATDEEDEEEEISKEA